MSSPAPWHIAYVFERFPSFTQTFCVREILELKRQGIRPLIYSIRDTRDEDIRHFPAELFDSVHFLPPPDDLTSQVRAWKDAHSLPRRVGITLRHWTDQPDKARVYEAAWSTKHLASLGPAAPRHVLLRVRGDEEELHDEAGGRGRKERKATTRGMLCARVVGGGR